MIELKRISKRYGDQEIFKNFSLKIPDSDFVIISGASGKGKTTLLNIIGLLEPFDSGEFTVDGVSYVSPKAQRDYWMTKVGFLFQNFALMENKTVRQNLDIIKGIARSDYTIDEVLDIVGLSAKKNSKIYTLSGGEQQRIALARLFLKKCSIVLADEPTGSLDRKNAQLVMRLINDLNVAGKTIILVTHDETMKVMGKRIIEL
jgi:putative ABC transport system ATP-binding protein